MADLSEHELHYVEVVRAEAEDKREEDEEDDRVGPVVSARSARHRILLGRIPQFQIDPSVARHYDRERAAKRDKACQD